jgi:hypothetical protein
MLLWILAGLVLLVVALFAVGHLLPAVHRGEATADLPLGIDTVWAAAHAVEQLPISGQARHVERLPDADGRPSWVEDLGSTRLTVVTESWEPPRTAVRRVTDAEAPVSMRMEIALAPLEGGTRATARMSIEIATTSWQGPFFRWMMLLTGGARLAVRSWLRRLNKTCAAAAATRSGPPGGA